MFAYSPSPHINGGLLTVANIIYITVRFNADIFQFCLNSYHSIGQNINFWEAIVTQQYKRTSSKSTFISNILRNIFHVIQNPEEKSIL